MAESNLRERVSWEIEQKICAACAAQICMGFSVIIRQLCWF